jgi:hypothetical protein
MLENSSVRLHKFNWSNYITKPCIYFSASIKTIWYFVLKFEHFHEYLKISQEYIFIALNQEVPITILNG